ncbi:hypothetical protein niasHT_002049 [Heterodera trifolii]|uniref:PDZ domain-containing protein n=1 Tax=Heterodera trifolii TaxID=157864 RepID=A0ABD2M2Z5_9BILA
MEKESAKEWVDSTAAQFGQTLAQSVGGRPSFWPSPFVLRDSFHFFGISLRTPSEYYHFLEMTKDEKSEMNLKDGEEKQQKQSELSFGGERRKSARIWQEKEQRKRRMNQSSNLSTVSAVDHFVCTCALPSTSSAPSKCQRAPLFGKIFVQVRKSPGQPLGLGIAGGVDRPIGPIVSFLRPGFIAHRCDQIQVGDRIVSINGVNVGTLTHGQILALLRNGGSDLVDLELEYELDKDATESSRNEAALQRKTVELELVDEKSADGWGNFGLTVRGGAYGPDPTKSRPLIVTSIRAGGAAHREGRLRVGDRLTAIDGVSVRECTLAAAFGALRSASRAGRLLLTVEYDVSQLNSLRWTGDTLKLEIEKVPGIDFGAELDIRHSLSNGHTKRSSVTVKGIVPASVADRCGAIQIGDELLAIDGITLEMISGMAEAYQLLRSESAVLRLELVPTKERRERQNGEKNVQNEKKRLAKLDGMGPSQKLIPLLLPPLIAPVRFPPFSLPSLFRLPSLPLPSFSPRLIRARQLRVEEEKATTNLRRQNTKNGTKKHCQESGRTSAGSVSARLSSAPDSMGTICHSESMEVTLNQDNTNKWSSFGIVLGKRRSGECCDADGTVPMPLLIERVERGSPAEKSGVLQPGDRIISINEWNTADGTVEEAQVNQAKPSQDIWLLRLFWLTISREFAFPHFHFFLFLHLLCACSFSSARSVILLVEFSVIESVLPPGPGTLFVVRLAKRGSSLGIVCRSEHKGAAKGEPLIISDIRMGSVAHRCGSIQSGDRIHSIDDIPLGACTVEESVRLLHRSAPIVKLCIAKGGGEEQDLLLGTSHSVVYSVEMCRRGRPLGVTIASAGGISDPIVISRLMPGELAERTGALHVGDRIVAINGEPIEGKKVGHVTQMLQQCADPLNIKLCRAESSHEPGQIGQMPSVGHCFSTKTANWCSATELRFSNGIDETYEDTPKMGTPLKSVDSAVDSMEDSPPIGNKQNNLRHGTARLAHLRPSTSNNFQQVDRLSEQCCAGWDSGLSSAAATDSQSGGGQQQHNAATCQSTDVARTSLEERCCVCRNEQRSCPTTASTSPEWSTLTEKEDKEDWVRILDALETVGEEEMLRKLEECILSGQASNYTTNRGAKKCSNDFANFTQNGFFSCRFPSNFAIKGMNSLKTPLASTNYHAGESVRNIASVTLPRPQTPGEKQKGEQMCHNGNTFVVELPPPMPSPRAASNALALLTQLNSNGKVGEVSSTVPPIIPSHNASTFAPSADEEEHHRVRCSSVVPFITSPTEDDGNCEQEEEENEANEEEEDQFDSEVFTIQLCRCPYTKSFGFSVCDGTADEAARGEREQQRHGGIYVKSVVKDGPADKSGRVLPGDRILNINRRSIQFLTCDLALPLLATDRVELLLSRKRTKKGGLFKKRND